MQYTELAISGVTLVTPDLLQDDRGYFLEQFNLESFEQNLNRTISTAQMNIGVSRSGVVRGLHFSRLPGHPYYITCVNGVIIDIVLDVRVGSPTFGEYVSVELDAIRHRALFIAEGLAHGIVSLTDRAMFSYLTPGIWDPSSQVQINPLSPELDLPWPETIARPDLLSEKDRTAPTLAQAYEQGLLPSHTECLALYRRRSLARKRADRGPSAPARPARRAH